MSAFKDHFSGHAALYRRRRPSYPDALAGYVADLAPGRGLAWEAGCGSGQLTLQLARRFGRVLATDASAEQLAHAPPAPNVEYRRAPAGESGLHVGSIDAAVAAQAAHWFELDSYYGEIRRVGRPRAVVALITYGLLRIDRDVDRVVDAFYERIEAFWPPERRLVEEGYRSIPFPFDEIPPPSFEIEEDWTLEQTLGYVTSWSGVRAFLRAEGPGALDHMEKELERRWGETTVRRVRWPLAMRVGRL